MRGKSGIISQRDLQYRKFQAYGFLKNLRFFEPFLMLFFLEKGLSFTQIGSIYAAREISRYIFEIPSGVLADAWGRRRVLAGSFIFYILSFTIFYLSKSYSFILSAMIVYAFGDAFRTGTHKAMIFEYLKIKNRESEKVSYYGGTRAASQTGSAFSSLIAAAIVFWSGKYELIFLFSIIPYLIDFVLILTYPSSLDGENSKLSSGIILKRLMDTLRDLIISFRKEPIFIKILGLSSYSGYYKAAKDYLQPIIQSGILIIPVFNLLETNQRTALIVGIVYFIIYLLTAWSSKNAGRFLHRFSNYKKALWLSLIIGTGAGILAGIFSISGWKLLAIIPFILIFVMENVRKPIGIAYISEDMEKNVLASSLSAESQISSLIAGILAFLMGFIVDRTSVGTAIIIISVFMILASPLIFHQFKKN